MLLADEFSAEPDSDSVGPAARLQLRQEMPHVGLDRLLGKEESLADLAIHKTLSNELEDLDLASSRLLLQLARWRRPQWYNLRSGVAADASTLRCLFEAASVVEVPRQNLSAFCLIHAQSIGAVPRLAVP